MSQETLGFIGSGNIYVFGKCKSECTNVYLCTDPKIRSVELNEYVEFLRFILFLTHNLTCIPTYVERMNIIFNLVGNKSSKAFLLHLFDRLRYILVRTLPFTVNRFVIYGDISEIKEKVIEFKRKMASFCEVLVIEEDEKDALTEIIDENQLESKFGGSRPNLEEYWPPIHHTIPKDSIDDEDLGRLRTIPFFIYDEDYINFKNQHVPLDVKVDSRTRAAFKFKSKI